MLSLHVNDFTAWRNHARHLLISDVAPSEVQWTTGQQASLFADDTTLQATGDAERSKLTVPRNFLSLAKLVACFIDKIHPSRKWALMYSLLWRINNENRATLLLSSDPEVLEFKRMAKSVSRDRHKIEAFLRFQRCKVSEIELYTAWFEPDHAIIEIAAPFFARRFAGMHWTISTPHGCAHWDTKTLKLSPGITRPELTEDEFDDFWRAYYASIFNPARLKEKAMMTEMPKKYWRYLPEARLIKTLTRNAASSTDSMIGSASTAADRVRRKSATLRAHQDELRARNRE